MSSTKLISGREIPVQSDLTSYKRVKILVSDVIPDPNQPRTYFDGAAARELGQSIKTEKQKDAIEVTPPNAQGKYMICDGERRWREHVESGEKYIVADIREDLVDGLDRHLSAFTSNLHQDPMIPLDTARALKRQKDERDLTIAELAELVGMKVSTINRHMHLVRLHPDVAECTRPDTENDRQLSFDGAVRVSQKIAFEDQVEFLNTVSEIAAARRRHKPTMRDGIPREILMEQIAFYEKEKNVVKKTPKPREKKERDTTEEDDSKSLIALIEAAGPFLLAIDNVFDEATPKAIRDFYLRLASSERDALKQSMDQMCAIDEIIEKFFAAADDSITPHVGSSLTDQKKETFKRTLETIAQLRSIVYKKS